MDRADVTHLPRFADGSIRIEKNTKRIVASFASDSETNKAAEQARQQICRYADTVNVSENIADTTLHKVIVIYRGVEMVECEEITADSKTII